MKHRVSFEVRSLRSSIVSACHSKKTQGLFRSYDRQGHRKVTLYHAIYSLIHKSFQSLSTGNKKEIVSFIVDYCNVTVTVFQYGRRELPIGCNKGSNSLIINNTTMFLTKQLERKP